MKKAHLFTVVLLAVITMFVLYGTASAAYTTVQIGSNAYDYNVVPINDSGQATWVSGDGGIFLYESGVNIPLTGSGGYDWKPQINNSGQVVWAGYDGEIYLYESGATTQLTGNTHDNMDPQINDSGQVVWASTRGLFLYSGGVATQIPGSGDYDWSPQINNSGEVVWMDASGVDGEIYLYSGGTTVRLTDNTIDDLEPQINDSGQVVWNGYDGARSEIFLYGGGTTTQLTSNGFGWHPQINNAGQVVWHGHDGSDYEIILYGSGVTTALTNNSVDDWSPRINDSGQVVWHDLSQVILWSGGATTEIDPGSGGYRPEINNRGQITWYAYAGGFPDVYLTTADCNGSRPALSLSAVDTFWASYADYTARELTVQARITNAGGVTAYGTSITGAASDSNVTLSSSMPLSIGDIKSSASHDFPVRYHVPAGVAGFRISFTGSASDICGTGYVYP